MPAAFTILSSTSGDTRLAPTFRSRRTMRYRSALLWRALVDEFNPQMDIALTFPTEHSSSWSPVGFVRGRQWGCSRPRNHAANASSRADSPVLPSRSTSHREEETSVSTTSRWPQRTASVSNEYEKVSDTDLLITSSGTSPSSLNRQIWSVYGQTEIGHYRRHLGPYIGLWVT